MQTSHPRLHSLLNALDNTLGVSRLHSDHRIFPLLYMFDFRNHNNGFKPHQNVTSFVKVNTENSISYCNITN